MPRYMNFEYSRIDSGIKIDKYTGSATVVNIPSRIAVLPVTSIGKEAFRRCMSLTSITIPNSVTSIGNYAFDGCWSLTSITIPYSVISIGDSAFRRCTSLTSITIPNSVTSIGYRAFSGCSSLTSITIGNGVTSIGDYAFSYCSSLTSITIGNGVTSIGEEAFINCKNLTSITIPNSVTEIGKKAFSDCKSLTSITIPNSVTSIDEWAFSDCKSLTSITIPNSVTSICSWAFHECTSLTNITIPNSVTSIGAYAFSYCSSLTSITIGNGVTSIGNSAFRDCTNLTSITIPSSVTEIGKKAFTGCTSLTSISIPDSVTSIDEWTFSDCKSLTSITIPNFVTSIGEYAFIGCKKLNKDIISKKFFSGTSKENLIWKIDDFGTLTISGNDNMYKKYSWLFMPDLIKNIVIKDGVTSIGDSAFSRCTSLTSITIPNSVTSIGESAFWDCKSLTSITIPNSVTEIGKKAFSDCKSLTSITIPNSVTFIGENAFTSCTSLTSITIPEGITFIGDNVFQECPELDTIYLPKNLKNVAGTIKSFRDKYSDIIHYYDLPSKIFNGIHSCKNKPNISTRHLNFVNQLELSLTKDYAPALNDSIIKIFDDIEAAYRKQQDIDNNPVINLTILLEEVSDRKIENAPKYIEKFDDEVAEIEARIKDDIAALEEKKKAILKQPAPSEDFKYTLSQSQGVQIDKYIGNETSVVIPEQIENLPVTVIGYRAFDNPDLRKVVIPESVKSIVYCAFVSQQPMHVLFKGYNIQMIPQSFLAPQITFYCARSSLVFSLRGIINNNPKCHVSYNAADFYKA